MPLRNVRQHLCAHEQERARNMTTIKKLAAVHRRLQACRACPGMCGTAVHGPAVETRIMLIGQAPGVHEGALGRPFAYTAGKTLFKWLGEATGLDEAALRAEIYFSAVARCFPGKSLKGAGDRPPSADEIRACRPHIRDEVRALKPSLILAVGKVAIAEVLGALDGAPRSNLADVVGKKFRVTFHGCEVDVIALPHPSGVSRWPQSDVGKRKLVAALRLLAADWARLARPCRELGAAFDEGQTV